METTDLVEVSSEAELRELVGEPPFSRRSTSPVSPWRSWTDSGWPARRSV
jgi:hypothetical protein